MNDEHNFLQAEREAIEKTLELLSPLLTKESLNEYEIIALGKLLQDVYSGIERILRFQLEKQGIQIHKSEAWHKELLQRALQETLISNSHFESFRSLLVFRHVQIHGYGFRLDKKQLCQLALSIIDPCRNFLSNIK